jgi:hypothetical protein
MFNSVTAMANVVLACIPAAAIGFAALLEVAKLA